MYWIGHFQGDLTFDSSTVMADDNTTAVNSGGVGAFMLRVKQLPPVSMCEGISGDGPCFTTLGGTCTDNGFWSYECACLGIMELYFEDTRSPRCALDCAKNLEEPRHSLVSVTNEQYPSTATYTCPGGYRPYLPDLHKFIQECGALGWSSRDDGISQGEPRCEKPLEYPPKCGSEDVSMVSGTDKVSCADDTVKAFLFGDRPVDNSEGGVTMYGTDIDHDGNFLVCGQSSGTFILGDLTVVGSRAFMAKLSPTGDVLWAFNASDSRTEAKDACQFDSEGNAVFVFSCYYSGGCVIAGEPQPNGRYVNDDRGYGRVRCSREDVPYTRTNHLCFMGGL